MSSAPWLQRWLPLITDRADCGPVLELGCGADPYREELNVKKLVAA